MSAMARSHAASHRNRHVPALGRACVTVAALVAVGIKAQFAPQRLRRDPTGPQLAPRGSAMTATFTFSFAVASAGLAISAIHWNTVK